MNSFRLVFFVAAVIWLLAASDASAAGLSWAEAATESADPTVSSSLSLFPGDLVFRTTQGSANPLQRTVRVIENGPGGLEWRATDNASWLAVSPASGTGSGGFSASVNAAGLAPGVYTGTITVAAPDPGIASGTITAVLIVNPAAPVRVAPWKGNRKGAVSISVDDSRGSCFDELTRNGFKGTYFLNGIVPSALFTTYYHAGMELGSHLTEHICSEVAPDFLRSRQIEEGIEGICRYTPQPCADVISLAWPCGYTSDREKFVSADHFLSARGYNHNLQETTLPEDYQDLKSFNSHEHTPYPPADLKSAVSDAEARGTWANLVFHDECNDDGAIDYAATRNVWVAPIGTIMKYLRQAERFVLSRYAETEAGVSLSFSRLPLPATAARSFEAAIHESDTLTLAIDIDDGKQISQVTLNGVSRQHAVTQSAGNSILLVDVPVSTTAGTLEIAYAVPASTAIALDRTTLDFAAHAGSDPESKKIVISNSGGGSLTWTASPDASTPAWLSITPVSGSGNGTVTVSVNSSGLAAGTYAKTVTISAPGATNSPQTVNVTFAISPAPSPAIFVSSVSSGDNLQLLYGAVTQGSTTDRVVTVKNNGNADLVIGNVSGATGAASPFSIQSDTCTSSTIPPAGGCSFIVRFGPLETGTFEDSFNIPSNDANNPTVTIGVSGTSLPSGSVNEVPGPLLVFPPKGQSGLGTTVTFRWKKPVGTASDTLSYRLYYCTDKSFSGCEPVNPAAKGASYAVLGLAGMLFFGMISPTRRGERSRLGLLILSVFLTTGILISCGQSHHNSHESGQEGDEMSVTVSNLRSGTQYYWKVAADDSKGGTAESEVWNFETE